MKQLVLPPPDAHLSVKAEYGAPQCRTIQVSLQLSVLTVSPPIPGYPGNYNDGDDIIIPDIF